jgi:phosphatidylinositol glycan class V
MGLASWLHPTYLSNCSGWKLFLIALCSRIALLGFMALSDWLVEDYDSSSAVSPSDSHSSSWTSTALPFVDNWDGWHYAHIARYGYSHENLCAFFPLFTAVIGGSYGRFLEQLGTLSEFITSATLLMTIVAMVSYSLAIVLLRRLTEVYVQEEAYRLSRRSENASMSDLQSPTAAGAPQRHPSNFVGVVALLYLCTPAASFTAVAYTEGLFCLLSMAGMWLCSSTPKKFAVSTGVELPIGDSSSLSGVVLFVPPGAGSIALASLCFLLATSVRSNGILLVGFLLYPLAVTLRLIPFTRSRPTALRIKPKGEEKDKSSVSTSSSRVVGQPATKFHRIFSGMMRQWGTLLTVAPYFAHNLFCYARFCGTNLPSVAPHLEKQPGLPVGEVHLHQPARFGPLAQAPEIVRCPEAWRSLYDYVQRKYWGVGWFAYYTPNNIPNFFIAAPAFGFVGASLWAEAGASEGVTFLPRLRRLLVRICNTPQLGYLCIMLAVALTRMHVQVVTRFIMSAPMLYWLMAELIVLWSPPTIADTGSIISNMRRGHTIFHALIPRSVGDLFLLYCLVWMFLSCAMFSNVMPWT